MAMKHQGFQSLLYLKFINEKLYRVEDVARKIGTSSSTLYNYIEGISTFPPDLIAPLYNATGDIDFLIFITKDTDKRLTHREATAGEKHVIEETLDVAASAGDLVKKVQLALKDGHISVSEAKRILRTVDKAHKELEELAGCIKKI